MVLVALVLQTENQPLGARGLRLFLNLHVGFLLLTVALVPLMTADCLARERRDGTLGLLFLTPLTATGVVIGKSIMQFLRAWSLWLAVVPVLVIPLTLGGLTGTMVAAAVAFELTVILLCLGAGLFVSSFVKRPYLAVVLAEILAWAAVLAMILMIGWVLTGSLVKAGVPVTPSSFYVFELGLAAVSGAGIPGSPQVLPGILAAEHLTVSMAFLVLVVLTAARKVEHSWQDRPPSRRLQWWAKHFCTELFQSSFRRKMKRTLEANPISWLQQYSWKSRLAKWSFCLLFVLVESLLMMALASSYNGYNYMFRGYTHSLQLFLALLLAMLYIYAGVSGFLVEKTSGALELILISPVSVPEIIFGRSIGLWKQFFPAIVSIVGLQIALVSINFEQFPFALDCMLACLFFSIPIYATYAALRVKWLIGAIALTCIALALVLAFAAAFAGVPQYFAMQSYGRWAQPDDIVAVMAFWFVLCNLAFVALTFFLLHHSLSKRIYSF